MTVNTGRKNSYNKGDPNRSGDLETLPDKSQYIKEDGRSQKNQEYHN